MNVLDPSQCSQINSQLKEEFQTSGVNSVNVDNVFYMDENGINVSEPYTFQTDTKLTETVSDNFKNELEVNTTNSGNVTQKQTFFNSAIKQTTTTNDTKTKSFNSVPYMTTKYSSNNVLSKSKIIQLNQAEASQTNTFYYNAFPDNILYTVIPNNYIIQTNIYIYLNESITPNLQTRELVVNNYNNSTYNITFIVQNIPNPIVYTINPFKSLTFLIQNNQVFSPLLYIISEKTMSIINTCIVEVEFDPVKIINIFCDIPWTIDDAVCVIDIPNDTVSNFKAINNGVIKDIEILSSINGTILSPNSIKINDIQKPCSFNFKVDI